jgi:hypothetical protein
MDLLLAEAYYCYKNIIVFTRSLVFPQSRLLPQVRDCIWNYKRNMILNKALAEKMWLQYIICSQIRNIALRTLGYCSFVLRHVDAPCPCAHRRHVALPGQTVLGDTYRSCGRVVLGGLRSLAIG